MNQRAKTITASAKTRRASKAKPGAKAAGESAGAARNGSRTATFPIVGIGCSAGGLEALETFFRNVPTDSNMAFVVVQHLDPHHVSTLPDLLRRVTGLAVCEAQDGLDTKPGNVYVIPPNKYLTLQHDRLHLFDLGVHGGPHLQVDVFLRSLADDRQGDAIGVILSGMGSDGVLGLRAIKEQGGLAVVQDPAEARADGMPKSAIDAGLADIVAEGARLPAAIADFVIRTRRMAVERPAAVESHSELRKIIYLIRDRCGTDFSEYKTSTLYRRIERRIALHQVHGIAEYVAYLRENPQEIDFLFKELLIGVTSFFRDQAVWDALRDNALPELFARHPNGAAFRAWVPACSSGEEAYSLAIVFNEALEQIRPQVRYTLQIYGTDLDPEAIDRARKAVYPDNISADMSRQRLERYFILAEDGYHVAKEIRNMVVFATQNVLSDPPFTKLDILSCRNLLIYLSAGLQKRLFPVLHYALNRDGLLVLGSAETIGNFSGLFSPIDNKSRIFRRVAQEAQRAPIPIPTGSAVEAPVAAETTVAKRSDSVEQLAGEYIQHQFAPPCVLVSGEGDILYINGRTGKYLEPAAGKVNVNIHAMARPGLREALIGVIRNAQRQSGPIRLHGVQVSTEGGMQLVDVVVQHLASPGPLQGRVLVVFYDVPPKSEVGKRLAKASAKQSLIEQELEQTREALRGAYSEMQTSVEEYKSANEELQSTNEELQSTNEELTTSKEELQSLNEELQTVNSELQSKVDELTSVRNDMTNLLNSTEIATIFLDNSLNIRRYTPHATQLFKFIPSDLGRPLSDIATELKYPELWTDVQAVLRTLVFREKRVQDSAGNYFRVRIKPYRTLDNVIDGVVITFIDITEQKNLAEKVHEGGAIADPGEPK